MKKISILLSILLVALFVYPCAAAEEQSIPYETSDEINSIATPPPSETQPMATQPMVGAVLGKSVNPQTINQNQIVTITIIIRNSGQTTLSDIEIVDTVPTNFELRSGETQAAYSALKPGETIGIQYTAQSTNAGTFTLDAATARFADQNDTYQTISSNNPWVEVVAPATDEQTDKPTDAPTNEPIATESPGFEGIAAIIGIIAMIGVLIKRT